ncbi:MAG TPA: hypothetical protein VEC37_10695, partial [Bacillota bacterium]|nr:hypothetical protein [Bacillota bacterium]
VLIKIVQSMPTASSGGTLTAVAPLYLDNFTGEIGMPMATPSEDGYLSGADYTKFANASKPVPADTFRLFAKGFTGGVPNTGPGIEVNDICYSFRSDNNEGVAGAGQVGFWQFIGGLDTQDVENYTPIDTAIVNVT